MKKHIPNIVTCCNLVSGCVAVVYALQGMASAALLWIVVGAVFDFFDGMTARLLGVSSPIGKELDSLADDVTFGVAPAALIFSELQVVHYPHALELLRSVLPYVAFVMAALSAVRLAKFNLDTRQATSFIGLPTPANALFWASLIAGLGPMLEHYVWYMPLLLVGALVSSWLLVAEIPMFALKFKHWGWHGNEFKYCFVLFAVVALVGAVAVAMALHLRHIAYAGFAVVIAAYVVASVVRRDGE